MSKTNTQIVEEFIEVIFNQKEFDHIFDYCSEDCIFAILPYVGLGINTDSSSGECVIVTEISPHGPAAGHLQEGDELIRIRDDQKTWETFQDIKNGLWGQGMLDTHLTMTVRRNGNVLSMPLKRGRVEAFNIRLSPEFIDGWRKDTLENWPDSHAEMKFILTEGDLVACLLVNTGTNMEYHRSAVWGECDFFRLKNGKITEMWGTSDSFALFKQLGYEIHEPVKETAI